VLGRLVLVRLSLGLILMITFRDSIRPSRRAFILRGMFFSTRGFPVEYGANMVLWNRKANAIGRSSKTVREFLERNYKEDMDREETIKLTVKSLLEVVQTGAKNIEIAIMEPGKEMEVCYFLPIRSRVVLMTHAQMMTVEEIEGYVKDIEKEKQEEAARKKTRGGGQSSSAGGAASGTSS